MGLKSEKLELELESEKFLIPVPHYNFCIVHCFLNNSLREPPQKKRFCLGPHPPHGFRTFRKLTSVLEKNHEKIICLER